MLVHMSTTFVLVLVSCLIKVWGSLREDGETSLGGYGYYMKDTNI